MEAKVHQCMASTWVLALPVSFVQTLAFLEICLEEVLRYMFTSAVGFSGGLGSRKIWQACSSQMLQCPSGSCALLEVFGHVYY